MTDCWEGCQPPKGANGFLYRVAARRGRRLIQPRRKMPTAIAKTSVVQEPSAKVELLPKDGPQEARFSDPENFINRELSWLEFNRRVLEEAQDPTQPLIERVKFLTIFSSNLDEFFEIRVAGIKQQIKSETSDIGPDGLSPTDTFDRIQKTVRRARGDAMRAVEK